MFKEQWRTWAYLVGIVVMFILLVLATQNFLIPFIAGNRKIDLSNGRINEPEFEIDTKNDYLAEIQTNQGKITIDLHEKNSPNNVNNFIYLANLEYYNGTKFHRLIPGLLAQGGDRNTLDTDDSNDGKGSPGYILDDEINFKSLKLSAEKIKQLQDLGFKSNEKVTSKVLKEYTLAMANAGPNTNASQFFLTFSDKSDDRLEQMNGRFTVLGYVINGYEVLDKIANIEVDNPNLLIPKPKTDVVINSIKILTR